MARPLEITEIASAFESVLLRVLESAFFLLQFGSRAQ